MRVNELEGVAMDNFEVKVVSMSLPHLRHAIALALTGHPNPVSYVVTDIHGVRTILFQWYVVDESKQVRFPYPLKIDQVVPMVWGWLENQDYGDEPDLDGSCSKGWRLFTKYPWKQGEPTNPAWNYVIFAVQPEWAEHHK